ncbi:MAG: hypothetical protein U0R19_13065 [Bryobacteraceae bacterium]
MPALLRGIRRFRLLGSTLFYVQTLIENHNRAYFVASPRDLLSVKGIPWWIAIFVFGSILLLNRRALTPIFLVFGPLVLLLMAVTTTMFVFQGLTTMMRLYVRARFADSSSDFNKIVALLLTYPKLYTRVVPDNATLMSWSRSRRNLCLAAYVVTQARQYPFVEIRIDEPTYRQAIRRINASLPLDSFLSCEFQPEVSHIGKGIGYEEYEETIDYGYPSRKGGDDNRGGRDTYSYLATREVEIDVKVIDSKAAVEFRAPDEVELTSTCR